MRLEAISRLVAAISITAFSMGTSVGTASGGTSGGEGKPGANLDRGTPTAIVVSGPSGEVGSWSSGRSGPRWECIYRDIYVDLEGSGRSGVDYLKGPVTPEAGRTYYLVCFDESDSVAFSDITHYDPSDPFGGIAAAERAAQLAQERLTLDLPDVGLSPPVGSDQIVGVATWLWVNNEWAPTSASATLGAVTATVTATPRSVVFDTGDTTTLTCSAGVAYDTSRSPREQHTDCSHTFIRPGDYTIRATITWDVTWSASTGQGDTLGTTTRTSDIAVHVVEIQAQIH